MTTLETERLTLRMPRLDDFEDYAAMWADAEVTQYISVDGKPMSRFAAWQSVTAQVGHWHLRGFGMFTMVERGTGAFVGRVGPWHPEGWPGLEIGWTLQRRYWGRGYATESARRCVRHAFDEPNQDRIISFILPENVRSTRVAERLG
jgi:RimJ/RimL family protein N-acetyltransferase